MRLGLALGLPMLASAGASSGAASRTADTTLLTADNGIVTADATSASPASGAVPASSWDGTLASVSGIAPAATTRDWGDIPQPATQVLFPDLMTIDRDTTIGVHGGCEGLVGDAIDYARVEAWVGGLRYDILSKTVNTRVVNGVTYSELGWHIPINYAATIAILNANGGGNAGLLPVSFRGVPKSPFMQPRVIGAFTIGVVQNHHPAPWDLSGPAIYDHIVQVDNTRSTDVNDSGLGTSGGIYQTFMRGVNRCNAVGAKRGLIYTIQNGGHSKVLNKDGSTGNNNVTGGPLVATSWTTLAADPRVVTRAWIGMGIGLTAGGANGGATMAWRHDGLRFLGPALVVDVHQIAEDFGSITIGGTTTNGHLMFEGGESFGGTPSGSRSNGVSGAGALVNGIIPQTSWVATGTGAGAAKNVYFCEWYHHDSVYGLGGATMVRHPRIANCAKPVPNIFSLYDPVIWNPGSYNSPNHVALDQIRFGFSGGSFGSANGYYEYGGLSGTTGGPANFSLYEDSATITASISGTTLTITGSNNVTVDATLVNKTIAKIGVILSNTKITASSGDGVHFTVNKSQTVASTTIMVSTYTLFIAATSASISNTQPDDIVADITTGSFSLSGVAVPGWSATLLCNTATRRAAAYLWWDNGTTHASSTGLPAQQVASGNTSVAQSITDVHGDVISHAGVGGSAAQSVVGVANVGTDKTYTNVVVTGLTAYNVLGAQGIFLDRSVAAMDILYQNCSIHDRSIADAGQAQTPGSWNGPSDNVVMRYVTIVGNIQGFGSDFHAYTTNGVFNCMRGVAVDNINLPPASGVQFRSMVIWLLTGGVSLPASFDSNSRNIGSGITTDPGTAPANTFVDPVGVAPYAIPGGAGGSIPNFTPANVSGFKLQTGDGLMGGRYDASGNDQIAA